MYFIVKTHSLRKVFLSIKGIYYQAEIQGQDIFWLVPYKFAQKVPADVDFRIMHTFVEFYTTLLGFVLFRMYTNLGLVYPPKFDEEADAKGAGLRAFKLESKVGQLPESTKESGNAKDNERALASLPEKIKNLTAEEPPAAEDQSEANKEDASKIDTFQPVATSGTVDVLEQPTTNGVSATATDPASIFSQTTFYLSRETPREPLEFLLRSCGCKRVGWDPVLGDGAFTENELDNSITHQIVDRPPIVALPPSKAQKTTTGGRIPGRIYVQPQYVWDCVNAGKILPPAEYAPGALLPPHLSPWVKVREGGYDPRAPVEIDEEEGEGDEVMEDDNGMQEDLESGSEEESNEEMVIEKDEEEEESDEDDEVQAQYQLELEAETTGVKPQQESNTKKQKEKKKKDKKQREEEEIKEMQKIMMPKKKRKLYEKMVYSNNKKDQEAEDLRRKRVKIEKEKRKGKADGK